MIRLFFILTLLCPLFGFGTDLKPWYTRYLEIQPRTTLIFQNYKEIRTTHGRIHHSSNDLFLNLSLSGAYDRWAVELETTTATTRKHSFEFCDARLTGRYQWWDSVVGDPVDVVTGISLIQACKTSIHDPSCFYHGKFEVETHLAVGKEIACEQFWTSRLWGVIGLGIADVGSPWIRIDAAWESNWQDTHELEIGLFTLWGCGGNSLHAGDPFKGYGSVQHDSVDLGFKYHYTFESCGILSLGYHRRLFALNFPSQVNLFYLSFLYPFGL